MVQGVTKRSRLSLLTNIDHVYEPNRGGGGGLRGLSHWVQLCTAHGAQINLWGLTLFLTYGETLPIQDQWLVKHNFFKTVWRPLVFFFEKYSTSSSARACIPPRCLVNKFLFSRKNYVQNKREISLKQRRHHRITTLHNFSMRGTVQFVSAPAFHRVGPASILGPCIRIHRSLTGR